MLNVGKIENGIVLDHIKAGSAMEIYHHLGLGKKTCCVAVILNARSQKMGRKDILKIEEAIDDINLDVLGYIDDSITVNVIRGGEIVEKKELKLPQRLTDVIHCHNPRCITTTEQELPHIFTLSNPEKKIYRCLYCEEEHKAKK